MTRPHTAALFCRNLPMISLLCPRFATITASSADALFCLRGFNFSASFLECFHQFSTRTESAVL